MQQVPPPSPTASREPVALRFRGWFACHLIVVGAIWLFGIAALGFVTERLDNDFARAAREDHLATVLLLQLGTLPAYGLIALWHAAVSWPMVAYRTRRRGLAPGMRFVRLRRLGAATVWTLIVFILGFGPLTYVGPGSLDTVAHFAAATWPTVDPYVFKTWHLQEIFTLVIAMLSIWSAIDLVPRAMAIVRGSRLLRFGLLWLAVATAGLLGWSRIGRLHAQPVRIDRPNIVIVASDSLRYDHLSCHGYPRATSPNIDRIAAEAVDFSSMYVATASTLESWASILTGKYPANHGLRYMFATKEQAARMTADPLTLPRILRDAGYESAVVGDWAANCFTFTDFGFDRTLTSDVQSLDVFLAEVTLRVHALVPHYFSHRVGEWLVPHIRQVTTYMNPSAMLRLFESEFERSHAAGKPFFGVLFVSATHLPYKPPYPFNVQFSDPEYRGPNRFRLGFDVDDFIQAGFPEAHSAAEKRHVIDLYDGCVSHFDAMVGEIDAWLARTGHDRDTVFIVTSDHGEDLYETGTTLGHGTNFFGGDQNNRIPLVMRLPGGRSAGRRVTGVTRNIDIMPTLLELAGIQTATPESDGVSLVPYVDGTAEDLGLAAFAETCYLFFPKKVPGEDVPLTKPADKTLFIDATFRNLFVLKPEYHDLVLETKDRMMRTGRWKLVYIKGRDAPIWRFWDMQEDPEQTTDRSADGLPQFEAMKGHLTEWMRTGKDERWPRSRD